MSIRFNYYNIFNLYLHNVGFMYCSYHFSVVIFSKFKSKLSNTIWCFFSDQLYTLYNTVNNFMLNTRIFTFSIFTNCNNIYIIIECFVAENIIILIERSTRVNIYLHWKRIELNQPCIANPVTGLIPFSSSIGSIQDLLIWISYIQFLDFINLILGFSPSRSWIAPIQLLLNLLQ